MMRSYAPQQGQDRPPPPPHNTQAEQALVGAILTNNDAFPLVATIVQAQHFYEPIHARIFEVAGQLIGEGKIASPVTLSHLFANDVTMNDLGGVGYLAKLVSSAISVVNAPDYAKIVRETSDCRDAIAAGIDLIESVSDIRAADNPHHEIARAISDLSAIVEDNSSKRRTAFTMKEAGVVVVDRLARIKQGGKDENAIPTGLPSLDETLGGGLRRGEFNILAARPGMGKTTLGVQIAMNVAETGCGVVYFSLEMPVTSLVERILSAKIWTTNYRVEYARIGGGKIGDDELGCLTSAASEFQEWPLIIEDSPGLTPTDIEARARVFAAKLERLGAPLGLIVVDHLHKCRWPGETNRAAEYSEVSGRLAEIGKRFGVPVLALAQLNRAVENRDDKRPTLADLRESGSIEQDADTVLFVYRDAYYVSRELDRCRGRSIEREADVRADLQRYQNSMEVIIGKQRNGPTGSVKLWCDMPSNVIRNSDGNTHWNGAA